MNLIKRRRLMLEGACNAICRTWSKVLPTCDRRCERQLNYIGDLPATGCKYATEVHMRMARAVLATWDSLDADIHPPDAADKLLRAALKEIEEDPGSLVVFDELGDNLGLGPKKQDGDVGC